MSLLTVSELRFHEFGPFSLKVGREECVGLSGPSGTGKTLLLRSIADLDPHEGEVQLDSQESTSLPAPRWRQQVGLLAAESEWWYDDVGAHFTRVDKALLSALGFEPDVMGWQISRLSTGEKQRLAILRLLVQQPRILLLDEPTANLDHGNRDRVEQLIRSYLSQRKAGALWVAHDPAQLERVTTRSYQLKDGTLISPEPAP